MSEFEKTVFVDSDNVLVSFYDAWKEMFGHDIQDKPGTAKDRKKNWQIFVDNNGFANLKLMPNALNLIALLNSLQNVNVVILSSSGRDYTHAQVMRQKCDNWRDLGIEWPSIVVPGKKHKQEYANPNTFLIDDHAENIQDFLMAGGEAFYYHDSDPVGFANLKKALLKFSGASDVVL